MRKYKGNPKESLDVVHSTDIVCRLRGSLVVWKRNEWMRIEKKNELKYKERGMGSRDEARIEYLEG